MPDRSKVNEHLKTEKFFHPYTPTSYQQACQFYQRNSNQGALPPKEGSSLIDGTVRNGFVVTLIPPEPSIAPSREETKELLSKWAQRHIGDEGIMKNVAYNNFKAEQRERKRRGK